LRMGRGVWQQDSEELLRALADIETRMRRDYSVMLEILAELDGRGAFVEQGYASLAALVRDVLRVSPREAQRRVGHARVLSETVAPSGATVSAALPRTAEAVRAGVLGPEHVDVIAKTLTGLPVGDGGWAEAILVEAGSTLDARAVARVGRELRARLDQDGLPPTDVELADPVNELRFHARSDGRMVFKGELEAEASALLQALLSPLAKPRPSSVEGPDRRSAAERNGDALVEILHLAAGTDGLPSESGEKPHLLVTVPLQSLVDGLRPGMLDGAGYLDARVARRLACDAKVIPAVLGAASEPLDIGRSSYTVPAAMRRALILRDGGCAFPGCGRPYQWCHAHHIKHWADGGDTALDNLVLLCGRHHRLIHHSRWECEVVNGRAVFRPPSFIDPERRPRNGWTSAPAPSAQ
jgi:Domain of unknown function (DUF222)/HNH endonuclease